jgi:hypothetical protein
MKRWLLAIVAVLLGCVVASQVDAQATSGRLAGRIADEDGMPLPGVTVTIQSDVEIGGSKLAVTGTDGRFVFVGLTPGEYTVRAGLDGFGTEERRGVKVDLGGTSSLNITMSVAQFEDEITVVAESPVIDTTQVNTEQVFSVDYLNRAAVGASNRSYQSVLTQAAGVAGGSNPNVFGSTMGENAYYVDGAETSDPVTGTWGVNFNFDAIQEIQFQTGGFEAQYGRSTGGLVNLVTKSGGNRFSGSVDLRYRDDSFLTDGEHFDTSERDEKFEDYGFTLGGPILRDRLWFFVAYEKPKTTFTPIDSELSRIFDGDYYLGKLTWQIHPNWRAVGKYSADPATITDRNASQWVAPGAGYTTDQGGDIASAELQAVLSDSLFWNTILSRQRIEYSDTPTSGDLETIHHYNYQTYMSTENYWNQQYSDRDRDEFKTNLTWFVDDLGGSHEFKGGFEFTDGFFSSANCNTGAVGGTVCEPGNPGHWFGDLGDPAYPYYMSEADSEGFLDYTSGLTTLYVQDNWRLAPSLTLKLGLRYDRATFDGDTGEQVADLNTLQPRIGVAWDIANTGKNVVRLSWGRFMHPSALFLPEIASSRASTATDWYACSSTAGWWYGIAPEDCRTVMEASGWLWREDPEGWDPYGWYSGHWIYGSEPDQIDPSLDPTVAEEFIVSYERALAPHTSIEFSYVDKKTTDIIEDTCNGNWPEVAASDACDFYVAANLPDLSRDYQGFMVKFESRTLAWFHILSSYTYSTSEGNIEYTQAQGADFDFYPHHFVNRYGYLSDHRKHRFKLNGYFLLPYNFTLGIDSFYSSPYRWTPTENRADDPSIPYGFRYAEPRGSGEGSSAYRTDLQASWALVLRNTRFQIIGTVYNVFGTEYGTTTCTSVSGCGSYETGETTEWATPRRYEIGLRFEF